ncbi:MAG: type II toxin-antitoxin system prevent-host-death family antitoxin [Acidimicrobiales bacterium]|nr:type II toxin-antitoxin system prevent-host-death family antitoxin [Acidimicrobiales bacterium]
MDTRISQRELRNDSGRIMRAVDAGQTFIVTRNGEPIGELRPIRRERFVRADIAMELFRSAPAVESNRLRQDLDALTDQGLEPRV